MNAIVGTAGHIDHGKSALVRALTGIETDRLPEERERGISIELGFAHLDVEGIGRVGVVDVPGHERFLRQMLAGAHGFDLVLIVVAADDGVMPQTEEHFDIVHLLGVRRAVFVITKTDAATPSRVEDVRGEIEILAVGTRFEDAPVVAVSARSGEGLDELRRLLAAVLADLEPKPRTGLLRVPVDRVFVLRGHGVVVTGTALAGAVAPGDEVRVLPSGRTARVREVQVHGRAAPVACAGERVAMNLAGLGRDDVARGESVVAASAASSLVTSRFDARIEVRPAAGGPLASHVRVRVHHGTRETMARLVWLDGVEEVAPRRSALAQLSTTEPLVAMAGDRFVIRDETASRTLGGGVVLLAQAEKHRRSRGEVAPLLAVLEESDAGRRLDAALRLATGFAMTPSEAAAAAGIEETDLPSLLAGEGRGVSSTTADGAAEPSAMSTVLALPDAAAPAALVAASRAADYLGRLLEAVQAFQASSPDLPGIDLEHLRGTLRPVLDPKLFRLLVETLLSGASPRLERRGNLVHTPGHAPSLAGADDSLATRLLARVVAAGVMPPTLKEFAEEAGVDASRVVKIANVLVERGELVKVTAELWFARGVVEETARRLEDHLRREGEITAAGFRDLVAASRKYGIPLLDWFDRTGLTLRVGDVRRLRRA